MFPAALGLLADHGQACCKGTCWGLVRSHVALSDPSGPPQSCVCAGGGFGWAQSGVVKKAAGRQSDPSLQQSRQIRRGVEPLG
jgi:hypothetical protein